MKTNIGGWCRYTVLDDHITGTTKASSKVPYTACRSHPNERLPTSTVKEQIFLLTKLKTRRQCTCTFTYFMQSDPRVVFSVSDVLSCHRETRWYSDNAGVVSLLQTLAYRQQTHDRRFSADGSVLFSFVYVATLACQQQTRQSQLTLELSTCSPLEAFTAPQRLLAYTLRSCTAGTLRSRSA